MSDVVVVTGGSRGIGAATARLLARRGWSVCVGYREDHEAAQRVVADCEAAGVDAAAVTVDVAASDQVSSLFSTADELGSLGALVSNADITAAPARVDELTRLISSYGRREPYYEDSRRPICVSCAIAHRRLVSPGACPGRPQSVTPRQ